MKKFLILSCLFLLGCTTKTEKVSTTESLAHLEPCTVTFADGADFVPSSLFFSTVKGNALILCDSKGAIVLDSTMNADGVGNLRGLGIGNAFFIKEGDHIALSTANHCVDDLNQEMLVKNGNEISMIPTEYLSDIGFLSGVNIPDYTYKIGVFNETDTVYINGFIFQRKPIHVQIKGLGLLVNAKDFKGKKFKLIGKESYVQENSVYLRLDRNFEFSSLSGSPATNPKGELIGLYSGRSLFVQGTDTLFCARVSLFE